MADVLSAVINENVGVSVVVGHDGSVYTIYSISSDGLTKRWNKLQEKAKALTVQSEEANMIAHKWLRDKKNRGSKWFKIVKI
ncbi:hypothetical protein HMPREF9069_01062 [Atopobium sp. oral taxon 810 str. F0209]|nr:hypothetical protein HMPREF9069_01062 [Atopobium sp. oral taxon 810 str. F0209]